MPSITATRPILEERFPVLGFNVRTGASPSWFEVTLATDPNLFKPEAKSQRNAKNFYSSRRAGPLAAPRGEAVYLVPADVVAQFVGQPRLYYQLAVAPRADLSSAQPLNLPVGLIPSITISKTFTGRSRRLQIATRPGALTGRQVGYGDVDPKSLTWAGDAATPGKSVAVKTEAAGVAPSPATMVAKQSALGYDYSDGFDDGFWSQAQDAADNDPGEMDAGIDAPIPDDGVAMAGTSLSQALEDPDYSGAIRFIPAKYFGKRDSRTIRRIVIHITDGGPKIEGTIGWFQNPIGKDGQPVKVSAHYIVGQDGTIVQMVKENDIAWHASSANGDSIGIEHVANTRGLKPTEAQCCASAALVNTLSDKYQIDKKRIRRGEWGDGVTGIQGHRDADPKTGHQDCPDKVWNWDYYMALVAKGACFPMASAAELGQAGERHRKHTFRTPPKPLEIVAPIIPADPQAALQYMKDFQDRKQAWSAGFADTTFYPFSAICQLQVTLTDGRKGIGTGFYIAKDRILTCAHNLYDTTAVTVAPGRNDDKSAGASFSVDPSAWTIHPKYTPASRDYDLAVIRVNVPPPNELFFDILEELLQSRDSAVMVCGYSGKTQDRNKQHVDGDMVRTVGDNTLQYNLQTEPGASGSPVYYLWGREDEERQMSILETRVIGVHVAHSSDAPATLNEACRLTAEKIQWIQRIGQPVSTGSALGYGQRRKKEDLHKHGVAKAHALADPLQPGDVVKSGGKTYVVFDAEVRTGGVYAWINNNPGNITKSGEAESYGAYPGKGNGGFAIFPDETTGFNAIISFLRKRQEKTITQMMAIYAPPDDGKNPMLKGNDPAAYARAIAKKLSVPVETKVKDLSDDQLNTFAGEIQRIETGAQGTGTIYAYGDSALPAEIRERLPAPSAAAGPDTDGTADSTAQSYAALLGFQPLDQADIEKMKNEFVTNAASSSKQNCITITNAGLRKLYGAKLQNADGSRKGLGSTIQDTMQALQGYGLAQSSKIFEFEEAGGRITKGVARPDHLHESAEAWILQEADANAMSGWYGFGLSLMDGYHSVVLAVAFSGIGNAATKIYWADQIYSGWDDVTGGLDARITSLIQGWWDKLPADKKAKTRVTLWPLNA